jgi:predicted DNA-binding transcriptional regulator YafY
MRRADRLFQIVQYLRGRRLTTAAQMSAWLHVSERTIYRDIQSLSLSGIPVSGEAGVGYRISQHFDLPPIMFTLDEVEALVAGARAIESWGGASLADSARSAMAKIAQALPPTRRDEVERARVYAASMARSAIQSARIMPT